jgi:hypothetical protein
MSNFYFGAILCRAAHPLWADCHSISLSSLREGLGRYLASGVNLLTADAIPALPRHSADHAMIVVAFSQRLEWGLPGAEASGQNQRMRNPDKWSPMEPGGPEPPNARRGALLGLVLVILLVAGGWVLTRVLRGMAQTQDCALSGRSNCP